MSKSARTQRRYAKVNKNQTALTRFGFMTVAAGPNSNQMSQIQHQASPPLEIDATVEVPSVIPRQRSSTVLSDPVTSEKETTSGSDTEPEGTRDDEDLEMNVGEDESQFSADMDSVEIQAEDWEEELEETVHGPVSQVKGWDELRKQIKADLKKNSKTLPLSRLNQLFILSSFATLCLKGVSRIKASQEIAQQWHEHEGVHMARRICTLARHYQTFEQLPVERRGGSANTHSWLHDEMVEKHT